MIKHVTLAKPGGYAWLVVADGAVPELFADDLKAGAIKDVAGEDGVRSHILVDTFAGPVTVMVGQYLIKTDNMHVFGMTPESFEQVWVEYVAPSTDVA